MNYFISVYFMLWNTVTNHWLHYGGRYKIEEEASKFYTRAVFIKFKEMMELTSALIINPCVGTDNQFELRRNDPRAKKVLIVLVSPQEHSYECTCNRFHMNGVLCHHILKVMIHTNVQEIPDTYLIHRWSEEATICQGGTKSLVPNGSIVPETNTLRYNALCRKMAGLASRACFGPETYKLVDGWVDEADRMVEKLRLAGSVPESEAPEEVVEVTKNLMNPPKSAKKGRPKDKEKRKKPLLEHLQDQAKKKATKKQPNKKNKYACSYCRDESHIKRHCPVLQLEEQMQAEQEDRVRRETELTL
jgi:hypothetical protein